MKTRPITNLFEDKGLIVFKSEEKSIFDLKYGEIVHLFEKHGLILFRGFEIKPNEISIFTDMYTEKYARDAYRRGKRFEKNIIHNVDLGNDAHSLHSEGSYSPTSPEIIWFYCNISPENGGETTLCDGMKLWAALPIEIKAFFLKEPLRFDIEIPLDIKRKNKDKQTWLSNTPGTSGYIDWNLGLLVFTQLQYAIQKTRFGNSLSFANHLLADLGKDPQIKNKSILMSSGKNIPINYLNEIRKKSEELTYDHNWEKTDILMIDNKRFLHGRRSFAKGINRDIVIVQTERANFGYGSTTRGLGKELL